MGKKTNVLPNPSSSPIDLENLSENGYLGMIAEILHSMAPNNLSILEEKLAADLHPVASLELLLPRSLSHLSKLFKKPCWGADILHVSWSLHSDVQIHGHAKDTVELARRISEDGEGTSSLLLVVVD